MSKPAILAGISGRQHRQAAHVGAQHFGHGHGAVGLLVVFQNGHQRAAHGQARAVEGVQQLVLSGMVGKLVGTSDLGCQ